ncbi:YtxH domain-containing protein [Kineococcus terrestris]|uniref:YtxH domain-containing protein n=1 Tax=Kineococcus terrestris TaxID=2044856 RepID=UPI0034DAFB59
MKGKALFLVAGAAGYVLGTRAGRERYDQIAAAAGRLWGNPKVQEKVVDLQDRGTDMAKQAGAKLSDSAGAVAGQVKDKVTSGGGSGDGALGDQHHTRMPSD